ncbi:MAG: hypothetical protein FWH01_02015 [Oscillospiraceae bacterium]|nr:hypothetical protein [Oscillospiraceae bacterium]
MNSRINYVREYVMPMEHYFHFEDMLEADTAVYMNEVKSFGKALRKVTGAVKINYEMHANSGAHLCTPRFALDTLPHNIFILPCTTSSCHPINK